MILPETVRYPDTLAPVLVTMNMSAMPATLVVTLPFAVILTLLLPLTIELPAETVKLLNKPPSPTNIALAPVVDTFPPI